MDDGAGGGAVGGCTAAASSSGKQQRATAAGQPTHNRTHTYRHPTWISTGSNALRKQVLQLESY